MEKELTREADALFCLIYKHYLQRRKEGVPKGDAKMLGGSHDIHEKIISKWVHSDVDETCRELDRAGYLNCRYYDDEVGNAVIMDRGIIFMETRFKNGLDEVLKYLESIKKIILF